MKPAVAEQPRVRRRRVEREAVRAPRAALGRAVARQRPLEVAETTSPVRSRLTERKYDSAGPATIAMSPAKREPDDGARARGDADAPAARRRESSRRDRAGAARASREASAPRRLGMGRVGELAELAGDEVGGLLADVDGVVADPLEAARDDQHAQAPLARASSPPMLEHLLDGAAVRAVDQLVELDERLGARRGRAPRTSRSATRIISSARSPISSNASISLASPGRSSASLISLAIVTQ